MPRRGPVADWPPPAKARRVKLKPWAGTCPACGRERYTAAQHLCARCWAAVPTAFRDAAGEAAYLLGFGSPAQREYGDVARDPEAYGFSPGVGWALQQTLERRYRTALIACEVAARIFGDADDTA